jgi:hypothetical protein
LCPQQTDLGGSSGAFLLHIVSFSPYLFFSIISFFFPSLFLHQRAITVVVSILWFLFYAFFFSVFPSL